MIIALKMTLVNVSKRSVILFQLYHWLLSFC